MLPHLEGISSLLRLCKISQIICILFCLSFVSTDINPVLQAAGAILELHCANSTKARYVPLREFFLGHRRVLMADNEILVGIHIPLPSPSSKTFLRSYKQARRRDDPVKIVSAEFQVQLEQSVPANDQWCIVSACFSFSEMGSATTMAKNTPQQLVGLTWTRVTIDKACELAFKEMPLDEMSPVGQPKYRYNSLFTAT